MLILTRRIGEKLIIGDDICVTIADVRGGQVRIGIDAPKHIHIVREELLEKDQNNSSEPLDVHI